MKKTNRKYTVAWKKIIPLIALVVILAGFGIYKTSGLGIFSKEDPGSTDNEQTTSAEPSAQPNFSEGNEKSTNNDRSNEGTAIISDDQGNFVDVDTSNSSTSSSGEITVFTPTKNSLVRSGQRISGTSSIPEVNYRVIDSVSGVIATGTLSVVNDKFSGTLNFSTSAKEGRIDFFGTKSDGTEYSVVEIEVNYG